MKTLWRRWPMASSISSSSLPARPTNGSPRRSSSAPGGRLADDHPVRGSIADTEYGLGAALVERTARAADDRRAQFLPAEPGRLCLQRGLGLHRLIVRLVPGDPDVDSHRAEVCAALEFGLHHAPDTGIRLLAASLPRRTGQYTGR